MDTVARMFVSRFVLLYFRRLQEQEQFFNTWSLLISCRLSFGRVLGKKIQAPQDRDCDQDTGYEFIPPSSVSTSRPSTSGTAELDLTNNDITFTPDTQG